MSRSYRKHPFCGYSCASSDKLAKRKANRVLRRAVRHAIRNNEDVMPDIREVSNVYTMPKDGKQYFGDSDHMNVGMRK